MLKNKIMKRNKKVVIVCGPGILSHIREVNAAAKVKALSSSDLRTIDSKPRFVTSLAGAKQLEACLEKEFNNTLRMPAELLIKANPGAIGPNVKLLEHYDKANYFRGKVSKVNCKKEEASFAKARKKRKKTKKCRKRKKK